MSNNRRRSALLPGENHSSAMTPELALGALETALEAIIRGGHDFQGADRLATTALEVLPRTSLTKTEIDRARIIAFEIRSVASGSRVEATVPYLDAAVRLAERQGDRPLAARLAIRRATACVLASETALAFLQLRRARALLSGVGDEHLQLEYLTALQEWLWSQGRWEESLQLAERFIVPGSARWETPEWLDVRRAYLMRSRIEMGDRHGVYKWLSTHPSQDEPHSTNVLILYLQKLMEVRAFVLDPASGDAEAAFLRTEPIRIKHGFDPRGAREVAKLLDRA